MNPSSLFLLIQGSRSCRRLSQQPQQASGGATPWTGGQFIAGLKYRHKNLCVILKEPVHTYTRGSHPEPHGCELFGTFMRPPLTLQPPSRRTDELRGSALNSSSARFPDTPPPLFPSSALPPAKRQLYFIGTIASPSPSPVHAYGKCLCLLVSAVSPVAWLAKTVARLR